MYINTSIQETSSLPSNTSSQHVRIIFTTKSPAQVTTLKRISNWPPSFCYILGKVFGEKYK